MSALMVLAFAAAGLVVGSLLGLWVSGGVYDADRAEPKDVDIPEPTHTRPADVTDLKALRDDDIRHLFEGLNTTRVAAELQRELEFEEILMTPLTADQERILLKDEDVCKKTYHHITESDERRGCVAGVEKRAVGFKLLNWEAEGHTLTPIR